MTSPQSQSHAEDGGLGGAFEALREVSDRIALSIAAPEQILTAIRRHQELIAHETLAVSVALTDTLSGGFAGTVGAGEEILVRVVRA